VAGILLEYIYLINLSFSHRLFLLFSVPRSQHARQKRLTPRLSPAVTLPPVVSIRDKYVVTNLFGHVHALMFLQCAQIGLQRGFPTRNNITAGNSFPVLGELDGLGCRL